MRMDAVLYSLKNVSPDPVCKHTIALFPLPLSNWSEENLRTLMSAETFEFSRPVPNYNEQSIDPSRISDKVSTAALPFYYA